MPINTVLRQSRWFALVACGLVASSEKASGQDAGWDPAALVGHWRKTMTIYESVSDEHLVLHPDGTAENWTMAVSGPYERRDTRTPTRTGRWSVEGKILNIDWGDKQSSRPFFIEKGQLVWPNINNGRRFWERVRSSETAPAAVAPPVQRRVAPSTIDRSKFAELEADVAKSWQDYQQSAPEDLVDVTQRIANDGSAKAQFEMGVLSEFGFKSLRPDLRKAMEWYRKAANQGDVLAKQAFEDLSRSGTALSEFDTIKADLGRLSRIQKMLSGELDRMHESAMEAIRSIRDGKK